ncbi:YcbK family protein [Sphingobacterium cellulitidis]|uniref:YcbK family protein n=1 Tax=Sphingobacterium cellulitidis TaxID=1768011 RepID=UPI00370D35CF
MKLTENFSSEEFDCKDGTKVPEKYHGNLLRLAENLQVLRDYLGVPVTITGSGYRTPSHNRKVGGAPESKHLTAEAGDINAKGYNPKQLAAVIEKLILEGRMVQGGIGIYPNFVHYDIRGTKARW